MSTPPLSRRARSALFKALRAVFRAIPMSEPTRDSLRLRFLQGFPEIRPLPAQGQVQTAHERRPRVRADERCIGYVEYSEEPLPDPLPAKLVAFYLPQFHTIPENDEWWGKGFTEWRNVTRALPQFEGHLQPRLPGDLGFYDLRNPQVMRDQAKLAKAYGLTAFCFYFYWFGGKTLLEEPLRNWLADKSIEFQFCLCWANENWSRRWDGGNDEVLIAQHHSPEDDLAFIAYVADYLRDPRCMRIDGKPVLLLYRPMLLPDPKGTSERWRAWCRENGIGEIELAYVQSFERPVPRAIGFDASVEFPPSLGSRVDVTASQRLLNSAYRGSVLQWGTLPQPLPIGGQYRRYRGVNCGWDNEARRPGAGTSWIGATPSAYSRWLRQAIGDASPTVFVNAWNEWAEGAVLEPDARRGYAYLAATRDALRPPRPPQGPARPCVVVHAWYPSVFEEILDCLADGTAHPIRLVVTTGVQQRAELERAARRRGFEAEFIEVENRGRDILPFLAVSARLRREGEHAVLKLHTKQSPHRTDGSSWRHELLTALTAEPLDAIAARFAEDPRLGALVPVGHEVPMSYYWGANEQNVMILCDRIGIQRPDMQQTFASGSMYWIRLDVLAPFMETLCATDFEPEAGQVDGTLAHAVERLVAYSARVQGFHVGSIGAEAPARSRHYPYAT